MGAKISGNGHGNGNGHHIDYGDDENALLEQPTALRIRDRLRNIANALSRSDDYLSNDLFNLMLFHFWQIYRIRPNESDNYYATYCWHRATNYLTIGRSIDSYKRRYHGQPLLNEGTAEESSPAHCREIEEIFVTYHANPSRVASALDLVETIENYLSPRNEAVFALLLQELTFQEISVALRTAEETPRFHANRIRLVARQLLHNVRPEAWLDIWAVIRVLDNRAAHYEHLVRLLQQEFNVSRSTAIAAIRKAVKEGLLHKGADGVYRVTRREVVAVAVKEEVTKTKRLRRRASNVNSQTVH